MKYFIVLLSLLIHLNGYCQSDSAEVLITVVDSIVTVENATNKNLLILDSKGNIIVNKFLDFEYDEFILKKDKYLFDINGETFELII